MRRELVALALLGFASCGNTESAPTTDAAKSAPIASIVKLSGDVRVRHAGASAWVPVTQHTRIDAHDMIQTVGSGSVVLGISATGAELALAAGTTMRFDALPHAVNGRVVATIADPLRPTKLEVVTPPGVVVLSTESAGSRAEAAIEVAPEETSVELRAGRGALRLASGETPLEHRRMTFAREPAAIAPISILAPEDRATVRVQRKVTLDWQPVPDAESYEIELVAGPLLRRADVAKPPASVPIASGHYLWTVHALRGGQRVTASVPRELRVIVDDRAPVLALTTPAEGAVVKGTQVRIAGTSEPGAVITVAKKQVVVGATGAFAFDVALQRGLSNIVIAASDDLGNQRRLSRSVLCE